MTGQVLNGNVDIYNNIGNEWSIDASSIILVIGSTALRIPTARFILS